MKKLISFLSILALIGGVAVAEVQIDKGQEKDDSKSAFVVVRYGRTNAIANNGNMISKDRVVVWDTTSNDGVTVNLSTTSNDAAVAGVTIDDIPGSSRDNSAASDLGYDNWGRMRVYGRHASVSWDSSTLVGTQGGAIPAGSKVSVSGRATVGGAAGVFRAASEDASGLNNVSKDHFGFLSETPSAGDKTADIFIKTM